MKNLIQFKSKYLIALFNLLLIVFIFGLNSCNGNKHTTQPENKLLNNKIALETKTIITGADQTNKYLPLLKDKNIAVIANQTSVISKEDGSKEKDKILYTHLIDSLISLEINITKVFAPEHGFRGKADACR